MVNVADKYISVQANADGLSITGKEEIIDGHKTDWKIKCAARENTVGRRRVLLVVPILSLPCYRS